MESGDSATGATCGPLMRYEIPRMRPMNAPIAMNAFFFNVIGCGASARGILPGDLGVSDEVNSTGCPAAIGGDSPGSGVPVPAPNVPTVVRGNENGSGVWKSEGRGVNPDCPLDEWGNGVGKFANAASPEEAGSAGAAGIAGGVVMGAGGANELMESGS